MDPAQTTSKQDATPVNSQADRKHNYWMQAMEGGLFMGGVSVVAPDTLIPPLLGVQEPRSDRKRGFEE